MLPFYVRWKGTFARMGPLPEWDLRGMGPWVQGVWKPLGKSYKQGLPGVPFGARFAPLDPLRKRTLGAKKAKV